MEWLDQITRVRALDLIPLNNGSWVRANDGEIFYSSVGDVPIPGDLGLRLLHPDPAKNAERREFFLTILEFDQLMFKTFAHWFFADIIKETAKTLT